MINYFGASQVGTIRIQSNSTNAGAAAGSRAPDDILWEYVQKADDLFPGFNSEFSQLRTAFNQPNYQVASNVFGGGFGVAQSTGADYESGQIPHLAGNPELINRPFVVDAEKLQYIEDKLAEIFRLELKVKESTAHLIVFRDANNLASAEAELILESLGADLLLMNRLVNAVISQGWLQPELLRMLGQLKIKLFFKGPGFPNVALPLTLSLFSL